MLFQRLARACAARCNGATSTPVPSGAWHMVNLVPVLMLGEDVVCALQPDIARITQYFGAMVNPL